MPTYEYVCKACSHQFERFQSITAPSVRTCPKCGRKRVERKIGLGGAVIFKGGGFYETDYRSESYRKGEDAERKSEGKSDGKGDGKGDGKNDGKGDGKSSTKPETQSQTTPAAEPTARDEKRGATTTPKSSGDSTNNADKPTNSSGSTVDSTNTARASSRDDSKDTHPTPKGKSNARQGRGVGNVLQLGRIAKKSGPKTPARKRAR